MSSGPAPAARQRRPLANLRGITKPVGKSARSGPRPTPPGQKRCPECGSTDIREDDGFIVCQACFTQVGEANIVADVTFEEQAGGRATVQGGFVSDNARHAKTLGAGAYRRVGGGERNTLADIEAAGRRAITSLTTKLGITDNVAQQAISIWALAANLNFSAGRKTDEVAASCLYAACRRQTQNEIMFMDIAELVQIDVFRLGEVYKDLCRDVYLSNQTVGRQHFIEIEPLIWKYCKKLQFDDRTKDVALDALKIMKRMGRDWIVPGRHPAGLCGASIILAARMNNFRRSVREVVYVSKVADVTIAKRIEEFRRTKSAGLTVEEFRKYANRLKHQHDPPSLYLSHDRQQRLEKRKRKRLEHLSKKHTASPIEIPDDPSDDSSREDSMAPDGTLNPPSQSNSSATDPSREDSMAPELPPLPTQSSAIVEDTPRTTSLPTPPTTQFSQVSDLSDPAIAGPSSSSVGSKKRKADEAESHPTAADSGSKKRRETTVTPEASQMSKTSKQTARYDADGFAIPAVPIDPALKDLGPVDPALAGLNAITKKRRKKSDIPLIDLSQEELLEETRLEHEIQAMLDDEEVIDSRNEVEKAKDEERARVLAAKQIQIDAERSQARREAEGVQFGETPEWNPGDKLDELDLDKEFENDPEVMNCMLGPEEVQVKERIWVIHNEDWLRKQAEKEMMKKAALANGSSDRSGRKGKKGKKRGRMGDGSVLTESSTPIESPVDAAKAMLEKRAPVKSMHVDWKALNRLYGRDASVSASSREQTPASTAGDQADDDTDGANDASGGAEINDDERDKDTGPVADEVEGDNWDNMDVDNTQGDDEDEAEDDYRDAVTATETDEFGVVDTGFDDDDYEEYE